MGKWDKAKKGHDIQEHRWLGGTFGDGVEHCDQPWTWLHPDQGRPARGGRVGPNNHGMDKRSSDIMAQGRDVYNARIHGDMEAVERDAEEGLADMGYDVSGD
jgi:hypothetical protein